MLFSGDIAKGAKENQFNWEALQKSRLQEFAAISQNMDKEAEFQKEERAVLSDIYKQMAEQGKAEFLPGDQEAFKKKFQELREGIVKDMDKYSSVQSFWANSGLKSLSKFSEDLLGSEEYSNGVQNKAEYEIYARSLAAGNLYHKMSGTDAEGKVINYENQADLFNDLQSGKIKRIRYEGAYANEFDSSKLFKGHADKDILYTRDQYIREIDSQNISPQMKKALIKEYDAKQGKGYYMFKEDPNIKLQLQLKALEAQKAEADANANNYWTKHWRNGIGVKTVNRKDEYGNTYTTEVYTSDNSDVVTKEPEMFNLQEVKIKTEGTDLNKTKKEKSVQETEETNTGKKGEAEKSKFIIKNPSQVDIIPKHGNAVFGRGGAYKGLQTSFVNIVNDLGVTYSETRWAPGRMKNNDGSYSYAPSPDGTIIGHVSGTKESRMKAVEKEMEKRYGTAYIQYKNNRKELEPKLRALEKRKRILEVKNAEGVIIRQVEEEANKKGLTQSEQNTEIEKRLKKKYGNDYDIHKRNNLPEQDPNERNLEYVLKMNNEEWILKAAIEMASKGEGFVMGNITANDANGAVLNKHTDKNK